MSVKLSAFHVGDEKTDCRAISEQLKKIDGPSALELMNHRDVVEDSAILATGKNGEPLAFGYLIRP